MSLQSRAVTMTKQMIQIESTDPGTYENAMAEMDHRSAQL